MITLPERFNEFAEARRNGFLKVMELKENGAKICGTFCQYAPAEVIYAAGLYNVGLCGKSSSPIATAETQLPANLCPLIKASYGHALGRAALFLFFDVVVGRRPAMEKRRCMRCWGS